MGGWELDEYLIAFRRLLHFRILYGHEDTHFEISVWCFPVVYVMEVSCVAPHSCEAISIEMHVVRRTDSRFPNL
jgi:hypothetical protein